MPLQDVPKVSNATIGYSISEGIPSLQLKFKSSGKDEKLNNGSEVWANICAAKPKKTNEKKRDLFEKISIVNLGTNHFIVHSTSHLFTLQIL
jgi:hypothetical protein